MARTYQVMSCGSQFSTVDLVTVYRSDLLAPGSFMPVLSSHMLVTSWDDDGMPGYLSVISPQKQDFWKCKCCNSKSSTILCRPLFLSREFAYSIVGDDPDVGYAPADAWRLPSFL